MLPFKRISIAELARRYTLPDLYYIKHALAKCPDEQVALYEGDLVLGSLNLDFPPDFTNPEENFVMFVVTGDLVVTTHITCENTDGGRGLIVFGNLRAHDIAVGGQELYVRGNVEVERVYCGSYNHGSTTINGNLKAGLLISDDYRFWIKGTLDALRITTGCDRFGLLEGRDVDRNFDYENDEDGLGYGGARWVDGEIPAWYALTPACIDEYDEDQSFMFSALVDCIRADRTVLNPDFDPTSQECQSIRETQGSFSAAEDAYNADDYPQAAALYSQALAGGYPARHCHYKMGLCCYFDDQYDEAISHFTYCIDHHHQTQESLVKRASSRLLGLTGTDDETAYAAAWADCELAIAIPSEWDQHFLAEAYNLMGFSLNLQDRYEEALAPLAKALTIEDDNSNAHCNMAKSLWFLDRDAEALPYADRAIELNPDGNFNYLVKADCLFAAHQHAAALPVFTQYLERVPGSARARERLARCLVAMNQLDAAYEEAKRLFADHPQQSTINPDGFMAHALWLADREAEALPYAVRSVEQTPEPGYHFMVKAWCHAAQGEVAQALEDLHRYATVAPEDIGVWTAQAALYFDLERFTEMRRCLDRAHAIDPQDERVQELEKDYRDAQRMS